MVLLCAQLLAASFALAAGAPEPAQPRARVAILPVSAASADNAALTPARVRELSATIEKRLEHEDIESEEVDVGEPVAQCDDEPCRQRTLAARGVTHSLRVEIRGADRMYEVDLTIYEASTGKEVVSSGAACTVCGWADLRKLVGTEVDPLRRWLADEAEAPPPAASFSPSASLSPKVAHDDGGEHRRSKRPWMRPLGIGAVAAGLALTTTGAALLAINEREHLGRCEGPDEVDADGDCRYVYRTLAPGILSLVGGLGLSVTGVTLLVVGKRHAEIGVAATHRKVMISGRF